MRLTPLAAAAVALALAPLAPPSLAQDTAEAPSEDVRAAAERHVESDAVQGMLDRMLSPELLAEALRAQVGDQLPPEVADQIATITTEEIEAIEPQMEEAMIEATAETFTVEEIEAQMEFYQSDVGASILSKMQPFMTRFYEAAGPAMQEAQARMMQRLQEAMPAE